MYNFVKVHYYRRDSVNHPDPVHRSTPAATEPFVRE